MTIKVTYANQHITDYGKLSFSTNKQVHNYTCLDRMEISGILTVTKEAAAAGLLRLRHERSCFSLNFPNFRCIFFLYSFAVLKFMPMFQQFAKKNNSDWLSFMTSFNLILIGSLSALFHSFLDLFFALIVLSQR